MSTSLPLVPLNHLLLNHLWGAVLKLHWNPFKNEYPPWNYHSTRENTVVLCIRLGSVGWNFEAAKAICFFYVFSGIFSLPRISPTFSAWSPASLATRWWWIKGTTGSSTTSVVVPVQLRRKGGRSPDKNHAVVSHCLSSDWQFSG